MICGTCNQPIRTGELFHYAQRAVDETHCSAVHVVVGDVPVHAGPCPARLEIVDGRLLVGGVDMGDCREFGIETGTVADTPPRPQGA